MAKFELPIYDAESGEVAKVYKRAFMPVDLFIRFEQFAESLPAGQIKAQKDNVSQSKVDTDFFRSLEGLFRELFPELTADEYRNCVDTAQVLALFRTVMQKSTVLAASDGDGAKNA